MTPLSREWLRSKYWDEGLSTAQIAKLIGLSQSHIRRLMRKYAIPRRSISEAKRGIPAKRGDQSPSWRGGRVFLGSGRKYIGIRNPDHPYANSYGYVMEHRLVMEEHLGRRLEPGEIIHHINGDPRDNRIENLILFASRSKHTAFHRATRYDFITTLRFFEGLGKSLSTWENEILLTAGRLG